jgi:hypothetical protein
MSITAVSGFMNVRRNKQCIGIVYDTNGDFVVATSMDFNWNDKKDVHLGKIKMKSLKTKVIQIGDVPMILDKNAGYLRTARVHFEFPGYPGLKYHFVGYSPSSSQAYYVYETDPIGTIDHRLKDFVVSETSELEISVVNNKIRFEKVKEDQKYVVHIPTAAFVDGPTNLVDASKSIDDPNLYHSMNGFTLFIKSSTTSFGTVETPTIKIALNTLSFNNENYDYLNSNTPLLTQVIEYKINTVHFNIKGDNEFDEEISLHDIEVDFEISSKMLLISDHTYLVSYESSMMNHRDIVLRKLNKY